MASDSIDSEPIRARGIIVKDMTRHGFTWLRSRPTPQMYRDSERQRQPSISHLWLIFIPFFVLLCSAGSTFSKFSFPFYSERLSTLSNQNEIESKYSLSQNVLGNHTFHWYCCQGSRFEKEGALKFSYFSSLVIWKHIYRLANLEGNLFH